MARALVGDRPDGSVDVLSAYGKSRFPREDNGRNAPVVL
jgi:hypothetical protein